MRHYAIPAIAFICATACLVLGLWLAADSSAALLTGEASGIPWPAIACGDPCVIEDDAGGIIDTYAAQGRLAALGHVPVVVDGPCMSACTIFVDLDRVNVCVTQRALLGYHQGRMQKPDGTETFENIAYQTPGLEAYIAARGGLPEPDKGHLLMLNFAEASRFYRPCAGN